MDFVSDRPVADYCWEKKLPKTTTTTTYYYYYYTNKISFDSETIGNSVYIKNDHWIRAIHYYY